MSIVEQRIGPIIESVVKTVQLSATKVDKDLGKPWGIPLSDVARLTSEQRAEESRQRMAPITYLINGDGRRILCTCLSIYAGNTVDMKDTFIERLRNATVLLAHADQLGVDPLALSLSFAAIEALVCEKDRNVQQIKEHVPTLLCRLDETTNEKNEAKRVEQLKSQRKKKGKVLADLYGIRCDVMHGRKVQASKAATDAVRRVAAGIVRAAVCWRATREDVTDTSWEELICDLDDARPGRRNRMISGVPDLCELLPDKVPE
jgi:hypothetical protein